MATRAGTALTVSRAFITSLVSLLLAVAAHVSAGGLVPALWTLPLMLLLCTMSAAMWLDREASRLTIAGLLIVGQTSIHVAMTALSGHGEPIGADPTGVAGALRDALGHLAADLTPTHAPMALAHLVAAALAGLVLAHGERLLWNALRLVARAADAALLLVVRRVPLPAATTIPRRIDAGHLPVLHLQVLLGDTHARRGPPVSLRAA
ncbi:hypothetical protein [Nocardioides cavernaquae]|uniref:Uncharacterized protein n=1 Tax=Nocardioides cavernaquae TaxID=2321396 RepID=A0A3A5H905_9ACTN|nr:hypothetical protein [Nocardioides cavernaquae]RJS45865.1 hypothetical protein D4739_06240 [Nocardioides cavernaquae]